MTRFSMTDIITFPFRSILCPVDLSAHASHALRHGAALAGLAGAKLTVVCAWLTRISQVPRTSVNPATRCQFGPGPTSWGHGPWSSSFDEGTILDDHPRTTSC